MIMPTPRYAVVAYLRNSVGEFVEHLRTQLHPDLPHLPAHVTLLPPRCLADSEAAAQAMLERICALEESFQISLGDVETFVPATPTVFVRVTRGAYRLRELHDKLNTGPLAFKEEFPYMPHLTIVKMSNPAQAEQTYMAARQRWEQYTGPRRIGIGQMTFVREQEPYQWIDLAEFSLGRRSASAKGR